MKLGYSPISSESFPQLASCKTADKQHHDRQVFLRLGNFYKKTELKASTCLLNVELPQSARVL